MRGHAGRGRSGWWVRAALAGVLVAAGVAAGAEPLDIDPNTGVPRTAEGRERLRRARLTLDYLTKQNTEHLDSSDWLARAAAVIGLARLPTEAATDAIVDRLAKESHPVGKLVVWQAMLSRAGLLSDEQLETWIAETDDMMRRDLFHGDLRIGLLEVLSARPITPQARAYFARLLAHTSSLDSSDIPTLIAMGRALGAWRDAELVEMLLRGLRSSHTVVRCELILQAAGVGVPWHRTPGAARAYAEWWREKREEFTAGASPAGADALEPQFLPAPIDIRTFDPLDRKWRRELELGRMQLGSFSFVIAIDCSRSMRAEIDRLKRDIRIMFGAFEMIAREVGVGLTMFAPGGEVRHLPLTGDLGRLMAYVNAADIFGPVGDEEWAGALQQAIHKNRWPARGEFTRRAIVLISDEPIAKQQFERSMRIAKPAAEEGFRIYSVMIRSLEKAPSNPLSQPFDRTAGGSVFAEPEAEDTAQKGGKDGKGGKKNAGGKNRSKRSRRKDQGWERYDTLSEATGARAIEVRVPQGGLGLGLAPGGGKGRKGKAGPMAIAPVYPGGGPTSRILTLVLTDAINPHHADRIEPLVKVLVAYCQKAAPRIPERRKWGRPGAMERNR